LDDAERIPIDLGYGVTAVSLAQTDPHTSVREDGTIVVDVLAPQPCVSEPSTEQEIVVCAQAPDGAQAPIPPPHIPDLSEKMSKALNVKIGPLQLGSIPNGDGTYSFGVGFRF
jgi:hypothetical protein